MDALHIRSIGEAARLTVVENTNDGKPRFASAHLETRRNSCIVASSGENGEEAPD
jgi:hypothetical protein